MMPFFALHRSEPDISVAALLRRRMSDLAGEVLPRTRIYLDTRYWIFLRDALLGRPADSSHRELLAVLTAGVEAGELLCPLSETTYFELTRQRNPVSLLASSRLMDQLSHGVVIQHTKDRVRTEVRDFLLRTVVDGAVPPVPIRHVWLKIGHVIGTPVITADGWEPEEQLVAQKAFLDVLWNLTLEEMLTDTPPPPDFRAREVQTAREMTRDSKTHDVELRSFKKLYSAELAGFWDVHESAIRDACTMLFGSTFPEAPPPSEAEIAEQVPLWKNALRNIIRLGKAGTSLPTAQIVSGLHAAVRWNRNRGFKATDTYDFHHAAAALPYCDLFLTERFLGTVLERPPLAFAELFGTTIVHREQQAVVILKR
jgi:hypothetical protein